MGSKSMGATPVTATQVGKVSPAGQPVRRVRHQARESLAVMAFSAATSGVLAGGLLLLSTMAR